MKRETDLYPPVKRFLEGQGYEVKGEVEHCDVVAVRGDEDPVVVELKRSTSLKLVLQAVDRLAITPHVYLGVPATDRTLATQRKRLLKTLRMLGLGLLAIGARKVEVVLDPGPYRGPRRSAHRRTRLLGEFAKRVGDPTAGGADRRTPGTTAYRQRAVAIARHLDLSGPSKASDVAEAVSNPSARLVLYRDVYGWFERVGHGVYALSPRGREELPAWTSATSPTS